MKILLIDPDGGTRDTLSLGFNIGWPQHMLLWTGEGAKGIGLAESESPQLVIVEIDLPDTDGFDVVRQIRLFSDVPILILSEREGELDVVKGLELGADDYVVKPFSPLDLLARVRAIMRRAGMFSGEENGARPFVTSNLYVDFSSRDVLLDGDPVHLTPTEYKVLYQLVRNAGRLVTLQMLKQQVWDDSEYVDSGTVRKCVCHLRRKLHDNSGHSQMILNERGIGYKFVKTLQWEADEEREASYACAVH